MISRPSDAGGEDFEGVTAPEFLRRLAAEGVPPVTVRLVDWADEEGARFGHSLLGSSAASGSLVPAALHALTDRDGVRMVIELRRDAQPDVVLNQLLKFTPLMSPVMLS